MPISFWIGLYLVLLGFVCIGFGAWLGRIDVIEDVLNDASEKE